MCPRSSARTYLQVEGGYVFSLYVIIAANLPTHCINTEGIVEVASSDEIPHLSMNS